MLRNEIFFLNSKNSQSPFCGNLLSHFHKNFVKATTYLLTTTARSYRNYQRVDLTKKQEKAATQIIIRVIIISRFSTNHNVSHCALCSTLWKNEKL